jgi:dolichyl-phosphate-mannose--protein O-mannosyl transferase
MDGSCSAMVMSVKLWGWMAGAQLLLLVVNVWSRLGVEKRTKSHWIERKGFPFHPETKIMTINQ